MLKKVKFLQPSSAMAASMVFLLSAASEGQAHSGRYNSTLPAGSTQNPLQAGPFSRQQLGNLGSNMQFDRNYFLLIGSIKRQGDTITFYTWRDENIFLEAVVCSKQAIRDGQHTYSEYHPSYVSSKNPKGTITGKTTPSSYLERAASFACSNH